MALARFNADGSLDSTFGNAGLVTLDLDYSDSAFDIIQQADGKLVIAAEQRTPHLNGIAGTSRATFARFNADGSLDTSFGSGGTTLVDFGGGLESTAASLAPQDDGMLVAVGSVLGANQRTDMGLMRLTADGVLDPLFDGDGMVAVDFDGWRWGDCGRDSTRRGHCRCGLFVRKRPHSRDFGAGQRRWQSRQYIWRWR